VRISTRGRYSLEALLYLALRPAGEWSSTKSVAQGAGLSDGYLEQLFIPLRRAGIVQGMRGPLGGYQPGRPLEQITVGQVLRAVEGALEPVDCVRDSACPIRDSCPSRHTWASLYEAISRCVDSITLADLAAAYRAQDMEYAI